MWGNKLPALHATHVALGMILKLYVISPMLWPLQKTLDTLLNLLTYMMAMER